MTQKYFFFFFMYSVNTQIINIKQQIDQLENQITEAAEREDYTQAYIFNIYINILFLIICA